MSDRPEVMEQEAPRPRRVRRKKTPWETFKEAYLPLVVLALAIILVITMIVGIAKLAAGGSKKPPVETQETTPTTTADPNATPAEVQNALNWADKLAKQYDYEGAVALLEGVYTEDNRVAQAISDYNQAKGTLMVWPDNTEVPMISFQPLIVDTDRAWDGDENSAYYNRVSLTVDEFRKALAQIYSNGFVLVNITDLASQKGDTFSENVISLPEGKKPIIMSLVPAHYTALQAADGFARRLALDEGGNVTCEFVTANAEKLSGAYDFVTILEEFLADHPDFSYHGARAILGLNGDAGPLGYKLTDESEAAMAKDVATALKNLGYQFASFTYDGIRYGDSDAADVKSDIDMWKTTYDPILGQTDILIYAGGSDLSEYEGDAYAALYGAGFRYFCGLDNQSTSWVKITDAYLRTDRRTINGTRLMEDADLIDDLFDADSIISGDRP